MAGLAAPLEQAEASPGLLPPGLCSSIPSTQGPGHWQATSLNQPGPGLRHLLAGPLGTPRSSLGSWALLLPRMEMRMGVLPAWPQLPGSSPSTLGGVAHRLAPWPPFLTRWHHWLLQPRVCPSHESLVTQYVLWLLRGCVHRFVSVIQFFFILHTVFMKIIKPRTSGSNLTMKDPLSFRIVFEYHSPSHISVSPHQFSLFLMHFQVHCIIRPTYPTPFIPSA